MKSNPSKTTKAAQHRRFVETARQLECDEDKERFEKKLGKIAKAKPGTTARTKQPKPR